MRTGEQFITLAESHPGHSFVVLSSSPNCSDDYLDCLLLDPAYQGGKRTFMFISCCTAVNHLGHICMRDWLTAGKVNLSPHTWTCFKTLCPKKARVKSFISMVLHSLSPGCHHLHHSSTGQHLHFRSFWDRCNCLDFM